MSLQDKLHDSSIT